MSRRVRLVRNNLRQPEKLYPWLHTTWLHNGSYKARYSNERFLAPRGPGGLKINSVSGAQIRAWHKSLGSRSLVSLLRSECAIHLGLPPYYTGVSFVVHFIVIAFVRLYLLYATGRRQIGCASFPCLRITAISQTKGQLCVTTEDCEGNCKSVIYESRS